MSAPRKAPRPGPDRDDAPRLKIVIAPRALYDLAQAASAEVIPTGRAAETAQAAVTGDSFFLSHCRTCGTHGCLYCWQGGYISLCPPCTIARIERLAAAGEELHPTVLWLHVEATKDIAWMERKERDALSVELRAMPRCHRCGRFVAAEAARYWGPEGEGATRPHCSECQEICVSGREPCVPPEEPPLDLGADPADWTRPDAAEDA